MPVRSDRRPGPTTLPVVAWEATLACSRACPACPRGASPRRDPRELSTIEAMLMMNRLRTFGPLQLAIGGGDLLRRPDLHDLVGHGERLGLRIALDPCPGLSEASPPELPGRPEVVIGPTGDVRSRSRTAAPVGNVRNDDVVAVCRRILAAERDAAGRRARAGRAQVRLARWLGLKG